MTVEVLQVLVPEVEASKVKLKNKPVSSLLPKEDSGPKGVSMKGRRVSKEGKDIDSDSGSEEGEDCSSTSTGSVAEIEQEEGPKKASVEDKSIYTQQFIRDSMRTSLKSPVKSSKKKLTFAKTVKTWDGLGVCHSDFDELLFCFLVRGQSVGDGDVLQWTREDCGRILQLCRLLSDLIRRLRDQDPSNSGEKQVPCLPRGGGRAIRVERSYEPYLLSLLSVLATALTLSVQSPRRRNFESITKSQDLSGLLKHFTDNKADVERLVLSR